MKTAVLITCYNRVETTLRCLEVFFAQEMPKAMTFDVYLVDDASPDKTGERVKAAYPHVNVIMGTGKLFWCKGMRLAWDTAIASGKDYDFYLWLNDDIALLPGAIKGIFEDNDKVLSAYGKPGILVGAFSQSADDNKATYGLWGTSGIVQPNGEPQWEDGCGMNGNLVLVPYAVYKSIGPIYGGYCHGSGDFDYRMMGKEKGILAYSASHLCGVCPRQPDRYENLYDKSLVKRLSLLFNPKGRQLQDELVYRYRHWGLGRAILTLGHIIFITIFPCARKWKFSR